MKYLDEFRNPEIAKIILTQLHEITTQEWVLMEVCGGQTHSIIKNGIDQVIPDEIELVHGPGCPVCVTPLEMIDQALEIASQPDVIFCSFGDMLRVPGSEKDLFMVKSEGGDVRVVYSPLEAVKLARQHPDKEVVFFAVGFETTAPADAMAVWQAKREGLENFSILVSHVTVPGAMKALLESPNNRVQGYLAAGHVCTVMGYWEYEPIAEAYRIPIVVTGFESIDILEGIFETVQMLENGEYGVRNSYTRSVSHDGNKKSQEIIRQVFELGDRKWRGIGELPQSGYRLKPAYQKYDAAHKFSVGSIKTEESDRCISGEVLQGLKRPNECPAFGTECTPETPLGATMVSSEGACAAYYKYSRFRD
mgnify:CR=1 FL=1